MSKPLAPKPKWPEVKFTYPQSIKDAYYAGTLFSQWFEEYPPFPRKPESHYLFRERMLLSRQIPHSGPLGTNTRFFNEFFVGIQYILVGYDVISHPRRVEDELCYEKACELFGSREAADEIVPNSEIRGRSPDLIVFNRQTGAFRFVECKSKKEPFTKPQVERFVGIEEYLNHCEAVRKKVLSDASRPNLFLQLPPKRWIHVARVEPEP